MRDRVVLYLDMIEKQDQKLAKEMTSGNPSSHLCCGLIDTVRTTALDVRLQDLELSLRLYMSKQHVHPFNIEQHLVQAEGELPAH